MGGDPVTAGHPKDRTVRDNRAEHESLRKADEPLDLMDERLEMARVEAERPEWTWSPLLPLP